tara:strand:+ start:2200 stop:2742 length:543 start_codon:yes stop_codon:yes gene_type:complete
METTTENSKWILVYTKVKQEQRAKRNLENQGFEIFLPMIAFAKQNQTKSITLKPMFPRYLFVHINTALDKWTRIQSTRGVSHLVVFGKRLAEIPNQMITYFKSKADEKDIFNQKTIMRQFHKGEKLVVKTGTFKGIEATFLAKKSQERVRVLLSFANHLITAEIPASNVGEKEIIETFRL